MRQMKNFKQANYLISIYICMLLLFLIFNEFNSKFELFKSVIGGGLLGYSCYYFHDHNNAFFRLLSRSLLYISIFTFLLVIVLTP